MLFLRVLALVRGGCARRSHKLRPRGPERTAGPHPQRLQDASTNPVERAFNANKQLSRNVNYQPKKYTQLLTNYRYQEDQLYWWWRSQVRRELNKAAQRRELGEDVAQTSGEKLVVGTSHDALTEENPLNTQPLPEVRLIKLRQKKGL